MGSWRVARHEPSDYDRARMNSTYNEAVDDREWFVRLHSEARRLARAALRGMPPEFSLRTDDIVHEAFLKLLRGGVDAPRDPGHAVALIGQAVRFAVTDHVRSRNAVRRSAERTATAPDELQAVDGAHDTDLLDIDALLEELAADPQTESTARAFVLRFYVGLSEAETALALGVSVRTAERKIRFARGWLHRRLNR